MASHRAQDLENLAAHTSLLGANPARHSTGKWIIPRPGSGTFFIGQPLDGGEQR